MRYNFLHDKTLVDHSGKNKKRNTWKETIKELETEEGQI